MLDNTITLPVDVTNNGTLANVSFTRFEEQLNRSTYISDAHEPGKRDILAFYRSFPKPSGTFKGVRKTTVKFTTDTEVADSIGGTIECPIIVEVNFSLPIGVTVAQIVEMRQRILALLDNDTIMDNVNVLQMV